MVKNGSSRSKVLPKRGVKNYYFATCIHLLEPIYIINFLKALKVFNSSLHVH